MFSWCLTEEDKKRFGVVFKDFEKRYPHYEEDGSYQVLKRIYGLLESKECQAASMSSAPFDEKNYYRFCEDVTFLRNVIQFLLKESFGLSVFELKFMYHQILSTFRCRVSMPHYFEYTYFHDEEPFYTLISEFQGYQDILYYTFSQGLSYEDYTFLTHSYQVYQSELLRANILKMNLKYEDEATMRQSPFDTLYHKVILEEEQGCEKEFLKYVDYASSYGKDSLTLVSQRCKKELLNDPPMKRYISLVKTLRLSLEARQLLEKGIEK